jgi:hypothetical protein
MTDDLFRMSFMSRLNASIRGGLAPGQLGVVLARTGVGKSAFLVHVALGHLIRDTEVLHVSLQDRAAHVRSFYDEILAAIVRANGAGEGTAQLEMERNRVIHSFLGGDFSPARLGALLDTLAEVMDFRPAVVVLDGDVGLIANAEAWQRFARERDIRIWGAVTLHRDGGPRADDLACCADTAVQLAPSGADIALKVLRAGGQEVREPATLRLDPATMLVKGAEAAEEVVAPSPAPRTVTLVSGGATEAECAFGEAAERWGLAEINLHCEGHPPVRRRGARLLSAQEERRGAVSMAYVNRRLGRVWERGGPIAKVLPTQWHLVSQVRQLFVVGVIQPDGTVTGGTGWSVELAKRWNKAVWVYCQERQAWHRWDGAGWAEGEPVIETNAIGGTGTRSLTPSGRAAIDALFERSFGEQG